jgi:hypothetical protein
LEERKVRQHQNPGARFASVLLASFLFVQAQIAKGGTVAYMQVNTEER